MPKIGQKFPDFNLETYLPKEKQTKNLTLNDFKGKWLIVFFYPADFTFVCPTELRDMANRYDEIKKLNGEILAISTDTVYTHKAWLETEKLLENVDYPIAADHAGKLTRELNIFNEDNGVADRGVFIIDPDGVLQAFEIVADNIGRAAGEIVRKLKALDHVRQHPGHACPASWDEGAKDLKPSIKIAGKVYEELE